MGIWAGRGCPNPPLKANRFREIEIESGWKGGQLSDNIISLRNESRWNALLKDVWNDNPRRFVFGLYILLIALVFVVFLCGYAIRNGDGSSIGVFFSAVGSLVEALLVWVLGWSIVALARRCSVRSEIAALSSGAFILTAVYCAQCVSLAQSGAVIPLVAFENYNQIGLVSGTRKYWIAGFSLLAWLGFMVAIGIGRRREERKSEVHHFMCLRTGLVALACSLVVLICNFETLSPFDENQGVLLQATPVTALAKNSLVFLLGESVGGQPYLEKSMEEPFYYNKWNSFPFVRPGAEPLPLPFEIGGKRLEKPNIIVLFLEGVSARTLGCYDERRRGLTPNIDEFAEDSMRVLNYYSHTAATFRGIHGQLASCFPFRGTWENVDRPGSDELRSAHSYLTVADILKKRGYSTVFFSPHPDSNGLNTMIDMLGFDTIYSMDKAQAELLGNAGQPRDARYGNTLTDRESFGGLIAYLKKREGGDVNMPFFAGLYNIGTHASFDIPESAGRFGNGKNPVLNNIHDMDAEFGHFYEYFRRSPHARNTLLVLTTDHAHYPEPAYYEIVRNDGDYKLIFCDKIPLIIHAGYGELPPVYDARQATSLAFAPSILQFLGVPAGPNAFLGRSIFQQEAAQEVELVALGPSFYAIYENRMYYEGEIPAAAAQSFARYKNYIKSYYFYEKYNKVFPATE